MLSIDHYCSLYVVDNECGICGRKMDKFERLIVDPNSWLNRFARVIFIAVILTLAVLVGAKFLDGSLRF